MAHSLIYQVHLCFQGIHLQPAYLGGYCCKLDDLLGLFLLFVCLWLSGHLIILFAFVAALRRRGLGSLCSLFFYVNINLKLLFLTSKKISHALAICKSSVWEHTDFSYLSGENKKNNHFNLLLKYGIWRAVRVTYSSLRHCNLTSKTETYLRLGVLALWLSVFIDLNWACFLMSECSNLFFPNPNM